MTKHSMCHCRQPDGGLGLATSDVVRESGRMQRCLWAVVATLVTIGCSPPCGKNQLCAVDGHGADTEVCDGDHWRTCGVSDGNHGLRIACGTPKVAVCGPDGWTFENSPTP